MYIKNRTITIIQTIRFMEVILKVKNISNRPLLSRAIKAIGLRGLDMILRLNTTSGWVNWEYLSELPFQNIQTAQVDRFISAILIQLNGKLQNKFIMPAFDMFISKILSIHQLIQFKSKSKHVFLVLLSKLIKKSRTTKRYLYYIYNYIYNVLI